MINGSESRLVQIRSSLAGFSPCRWRVGSRGPLSTVKDLRAHARSTFPLAKLWPLSSGLVSYHSGSLALKSPMMMVFLFMGVSSCGSMGKDGSV